MLMLATCQGGRETRSNHFWTNVKTFSYQSFAMATNAKLVLAQISALVRGRGAPNGGWREFKQSLQVWNNSD